MSNRFFYMKDINCVTIVEYASRKEILDLLDNHIDYCKKNAKGANFEISEEVFEILYKDGTIDYISEDYDGHKIRRQNIESIVECNSATYMVYGHFAINECGVVEPAFKDEINENLKEVYSEDYKESTPEQEQSEPEQEQTEEQEQAEQTEKIKVEDLNLSIRAYNALKRANIDSIQDFFSLSPEEIKMKIGEKNATEIILTLHQMGIEKPEKIPQKEGKEEPERIPEVPDTEEPEQEQTKQQSEESTPERKIVYKINVLKALKETGYNQGRIKREKLLNGSAVDKIRAGNTDISLKTLGTICNLLNAEPGDILTMT